MRELPCCASPAPLRPSILRAQRAMGRGSRDQLWCIQPCLSCCKRRCATHAALSTPAWGGAEARLLLGALRIGAGHGVVVVPSVRLVCQACAWRLPVVASTHCNISGCLLSLCAPSNVAGVPGRVAQRFGNGAMLSLYHCGPWQVLHLVDRSDGVARLSIRFWSRGDIICRRGRLSAACLGRVVALQAGCSMQGAGVARGWYLSIAFVFFAPLGWSKSAWR